MFEQLPYSTVRCLVVRFGGKPTGDEYRRFLDAAEAQLQPGRAPNLVVDLTGVTGYGDAEAARMDFKFGTGEYRRFHRAAMVGDQKWIDWYMRLISLFTPAEEKHFAARDLDAAITWAGEG